MFVGCVFSVVGCDFFLPPNVVAFALFPPPFLQVPDEDADVAVLEEPEHLNFFRAEGVPWLKKFE